MFWGLYPILVHEGVKLIPPLTFAVWSSFIASLGAFVYISITKRWHEILIKPAFLPMLMVTICITFIPYLLFYTGAKLTSGLNTSMLMLSEVVFTFLFAHRLKETITFNKLLGTMAILLGSFCLLYRGNLQINFGDILIFFSTLTYPIGNYYAKKALRLVSPMTIIFIRSLLSGIFLLPFALLFETIPSAINLFTNHWLILLVNGLLIGWFTKIIWYEGLKRIPITKAAALNMTFPLASLFVLFFIFHEQPTILQAIGILIMFIGIYFTVKISTKRLDIIPGFFM
jgi:drug/metabolite transporter (DMT)-like permease